jgi:hypothetical protein
VPSWSPRRIWGIWWSRYKSLGEHIQTVSCPFSSLKVFGFQLRVTPLSAPILALFESYLRRHFGCSLQSMLSLYRVSYQAVVFISRTWFPHLNATLRLNLFVFVQILLPYQLRSIQALFSYLLCLKHAYLVHRHLVGCICLHHHHQSLKVLFHSTWN